MLQAAASDRSQQALWGVDVTLTIEAVDELTATGYWKLLQWPAMEYRYIMPGSGHVICVHTQHPYLPF